MAFEFFIHPISAPEAFCRRMPNMKSLMGILLTVAAFLIAPASQAALIKYSANLTGAAQEPPTGSPGTGTAVVGFDNVKHVLSIAVTFTGLSSNQRSHIYIAAQRCPASAPRTLPRQPRHSRAFQQASRSGSYDMTSSTPHWRAHGTRRSSHERRNHGGGRGGSCSRIGGWQSVFQPSHFSISSR